MNILILLIGVIISLTYFMSFVWEMKQEKKRKEDELMDDKNYYTRNLLPKPKKHYQKNRITIIAIIFQLLALLYAIFKGYEDVVVMIIIFLFISTLDLFNKR